ncbi:MAG: hypothetical protein EZS28_032133, partial [Streblomastix strix]
VLSYNVLSSITILTYGLSEPFFIDDGNDKDGRPVSGGDYSVQGECGGEGFLGGEFDAFPILEFLGDKDVYDQNKEMTDYDDCYNNCQDEDEEVGQGGGVIGSEGGNNVNYDPTDGRIDVDDLVKFEEDDDYGIYDKERIDQGKIYQFDQVFKSEEDEEDEDDEDEDEGTIQFKEDDQVGITIEDEEDEEFDGKIEDVAVDEADNEDFGKYADYEIESDVYELNYEEDEGKSYFVEVCGQLINYYEDEDQTGKFADDDQIYDFVGEVEFSFVGDVIQFYEEFNNEDAEGTDIDVDETQGYYNQEEELYVIGIVPKEEDEEDEIYSFVFDYYQGGTDIQVDDIYQLEEEDETGVLCLGDDQYVQYEVYDENVGFVGD